MHKALKPKWIDNMKG